jgi:hypothetical protein
LQFFCTKLISSFLIQYSIYGDFVTKVVVVASVFEKAHGLNFNIHGQMKHSDHAPRILTGVALGLGSAALATALVRQRWMSGENRALLASIDAVDEARLSHASVVKLLCNQERTYVRIEHHNGQVSFFDRGRIYIYGVDPTSSLMSGVTDATFPPLGTGTEKALVLDPVMKERSVKIMPGTAQLTDALKRSAKTESLVVLVVPEAPRAGTNAVAQPSFLEIVNLLLAQNIIRAE